MKGEGRFVSVSKKCSVQPLEKMDACRLPYFYRVVFQWFVRSRILFVDYSKHFVIFEAKRSYV